MYNRQVPTYFFRHQQTLMIHSRFYFPNTAQIVLSPFARLNKHCGRAAGVLQVQTRVLLSIEYAYFIRNTDIKIFSAYIDRKIQANIFVHHQSQINFNGPPLITREPTFFHVKVDPGHVSRGALGVHLDHFGIHCCK